MSSKKIKGSIVFIFSVTILALTMGIHYIISQMPQLLPTTDVFANNDINAFDHTGVTPLMQAAIDSNFERAKMLLEHGADPNIASANSDKDYALNYALINGGKIGSLAVAQLLLAHGARTDVANARGLAPIHAIMQITNFENRAQMLKELMEKGTDINAQAEDGSTMLHITVTMNDIDWVTHLNTEYGQIINYQLKDYKGRTPLDLALQLGHVSVNNAESVENELRKRPRYIGDGYDVATTDSHGRNGLQLALIRNDKKFVEALVEHRTPINHQDNYGNTALHYAVASTDPLTYVPYLLKAGATPTIVNNNKQTAREWLIKIKQFNVRNQIHQLLLAATKDK